MVSIAVKLASTRCLSYNYGHGYRKEEYIETPARLADAPKSSGPVPPPGAARISGIIWSANSCNSYSACHRLLAQTLSFPGALSAHNHRAGRGWSLARADLYLRRGSLRGDAPGDPPGSQAHLLRDLYLERRYRGAEV